jgi:hypothetical protein
MHHGLRRAGFFRQNGQSSSGFNVTGTGAPFLRPGGWALAPGARFGSWWASPHWSSGAAGRGYQSSLRTQVWHQLKNVGSWAVAGAVFGVGATTLEYSMKGLVPIQIDENVMMSSVATDIWERPTKLPAWRRDSIVLNATSEISKGAKRLARNDSKSEHVQPNIKDFLASAFLNMSSSSSSSSSSTHGLLLLAIIPIIISIVLVFMLQKWLIKLCRLRLNRNMPLP